MSVAAVADRNIAMTGLIAWPAGPRPISANIFLDITPVDFCTLMESATDQYYACEDAYATDRPDGKGGAAIAPRNYPVGTLETFVGREPPLVKADAPDCEMTHRLSLYNQHGQVSEALKEAGARTHVPGRWPP
jgi:hypothetical protein